MEQQPSFDPLAEPDMLAAMTQAPPPINSWMSFDEPESSSFREPSDASTAFNRSSRSLGASQVGWAMCYPPVHPFNRCFDFAVLCSGQWDSFESSGSEMEYLVAGVVNLKRAESMEGYAGWRGGLERGTL